jgi:hypothetical protein
MMIRRAGKLGINARFPAFSVFSVNRLVSVVSGPL